MSVLVFVCLLVCVCVCVCVCVRAYDFVNMFLKKDHSKRFPDDRYTTILPDPFQEQLPINSRSVLKPQKPYYALQVFVFLPMTSMYVMPSPTSPYPNDPASHLLSTCLTHIAWHSRLQNSVNRCYNEDPRGLKSSF